MNLIEQFDCNTKVFSDWVASAFTLKVNSGQFEDPQYFREMLVGNGDRDIDLLVWNKGQAELTYYLAGWVVGESYENLDAEILDLVFDHLRVILTADSPAEIREVPGSQVQRWEGSVISSLGSV